ncbi:hypothetical protein BKA59DRAFT_552025 [Fusarium tricinctum]|uniref:Uncharacterized protein n=1 Tax=Fusarium tricinctum TaxID=61284 RepID=A0A8K0WEH2_9HYPO|nr:hypothetical protein BKA59DRAFT_552025 [Fusarium tricinctum]
MVRHDSDPSMSSLPFSLRTPNIYRIILVFISILLSFTFLNSIFKNYELGSPDGQRYGSDGPHTHGPADEDHRFAMVIPATSPSPDLCKTIMTALSLGYPIPVIINWGVDFRDITHSDRGKNLPKIPGFVKYLDAVMHSEAHPSERLREDDIVLMVDGYDMWFQLPAQVLLSRYHEINRKANERLLKQWNRKEPMPMRQTIVTGAGKRCAPNNRTKYGIDMLCDSWPESPLRKDMYGPDTDKFITEDCHDSRPRWINGGIYIGPAGDMRRLFRRTMERMEAGLGLRLPLISEQGMVGEIIGEQEVWRQRMREQPMARGKLADFMERDFEYHVGVDFGQVLSAQTASTVINETADLFDGDFVILGDQAAIDQHSKTRGISPARIRGVPDDIKDVPNPLLSLDQAANWSTMPLYADFFTESVPVILHHNGFKRSRSTWWDRPWYYKRLRELFKANLQPRELDEALVTLQHGGNRIRYWPVSAEATDRLPRRVNGTAVGRYPNLEFGNICRYDKEKVPKGYMKKWWDEIFRDGGGKPF